MDKDEKSSWQYKPDSNPESQEPAPDNPGTEASAESPLPAAAALSWTASEYIDHQHNVGWYAILAVGTAALTAGIYFLTKDYFATGVITLVGVIVGVFAAHKPRQITYAITSSGIKIGDKSYRFGQFRSFTIINEGNLNSISLLPLKRFMAPISAYYPPGDEEKIVDTLGEHLPYEERKPDRIDRITARLRF